MKGNLLIMIISLAVSVYSFGTQPVTESQKTFNNIVLKLNYSNVNSKQIVPVYDGQTASLQETLYPKNPQYGFEGLYRFNKLWAVGIYLGYSNGTFISNEMLGSDSESYNFTMDRFGRSYFYGLKTELQLLPLFFKAERLRLNVYCPLQVGLVSQSVTTNATNTDNWDKPAFEFGAGLGISYNFMQSLGAFGEILGGNFYNEQYLKWKAGITLTF